MLLAPLPARAPQKGNLGSSQAATNSNRPRRQSSQTDKHAAVLGRNELDPRLHQKPNGAKEREFPVKWADRAMVETWEIRTLLADVLTCDDLQLPKEANAGEDGTRECAGVV